MSSILTLAGNNTSDASFYPHTIDQSLRFEDGDSARLTRTPSSAGNRRTWTWSAWIKRGNISLSNKQRLFATQTGGGLEENFRFETSDKIRWYCHNATGESADNDLTTSAVFRDVSAWYHIVVVKDTTESTAANRNRLYVNGVLQSWAGTNYSSSNYEGFINQTNQHAIAAHAASVLDEFDGYMSEVVFLDGVAGDPTALGLGELKDGIWVAKNVSGLTYGTNGFHLDFADSGAIGNDVSGQNNDFAVSGLVASGVVLDSPTNNFNVINALDPLVSSSGVTLSEGNLRVQGGTSGNFNVVPTFDKVVGSYYAEFYVEATGNNTQSAIFVRTLVGGVAFNYQLKADGDLKKDGTTVATLSAFSAGDIIGASGSTDNNTVKFFVNGVSVYTDTHTSNFEKLSIVPRLDNTTTPIFICNYGQDSTFAGNTSAGGNSDSAGIGDFKYTVPAGAKAICSANLPEPAIIDASEYFNTVLYSGNSGTQDITTVGFQSDWVWNKRRDGTASHVIYDSVRGTGNEINSNNNAAEATGVSGVTAFLSNGYSLGNNGNINDSGETYASWNWLAGTAVSGATTGSGTAKTYTGSVNTKSGFSIIKYVGNGTSGHTIPHNLTVDGVATTPTMIIVKRLDNDGGWRVQHKDVAATHYLALDTDAAKANLDTIFNDTAFNSTVFTVGSAASINSNDADYIAYCFTDIDQYCKAGAYSGNGNADGTYIHLGFRPAIILTKRTDNTSNWNLLDSTRSTFNVMQDRIKANGVDAEGTHREVDFLSNGFKWRESGSDVNNGSYIFLAFAEQPAKFSNAR